MCLYNSVGVTIGFERTVYDVTEEDGNVELCAVLIAGRLDRVTAVIFATSDGTATGLCVQCSHRMNAYDIMSSVL